MVSLPIKLDARSVQLTDEQFYQLCVSNPEWQVERSPQGELVIMSPVGGESGNQEMEFGIDLGMWNRQTLLGKVFSSSTIFKLPGGGDRSPDAAWIQLSRWEALTPEQRRKFPPIAPDFVMELRAATDTLKSLQDKMEEYLASGVRLGWLINPKNQQVEIYRQDQEKEVRDLPTTLTGEQVLLGFELKIQRFR